MTEIDGWRLKDAHDSYYVAIEEVGRRVRAGEEEPRQGFHFQRVNCASGPAPAEAASEQHAAPADRVVTSPSVVAGKP